MNHKNIFEIKLYKVTKITLFNFNVNSELPKSIVIWNPVIKMLPKKQNTYLHASINRLEKTSDNTFTNIQI